MTSMYQFIDDIRSHIYHHECKLSYMLQRLNETRNISSDELATYMTEIIRCCHMCNVEMRKISTRRGLSLRFQEANTLMSLDELLQATLNNFLILKEGIGL